MADKRLIDANALLKSYDVAWMVEYDETGCGVRKKAIPTKTIDDIPTIDAVEVVHAHWVRASGKSHIWYCSACGDKINYKQNCRTYNIPKVPVEQKNKFCRNCGAQMGGGADNG